MRYFKARAKAWGIPYERYPSSKRSMLLPFASLTLDLRVEYVVRIRQQGNDHEEPQRGKPEQYTPPTIKTIAT